MSIHKHHFCTSIVHILIGRWRCIFYIYFQSEIVIMVWINVLIRIFWYKIWMPNEQDRICKNNFHCFFPDTAVKTTQWNECRVEKSILQKCLTLGFQCRGGMASRFDEVKSPPLSCGSIFYVSHFQPWEQRLKVWLFPKID